MKEFYLNGDCWRVQFVDPLSYYLVDRTGKRTVATTDPNSGTIFISNVLHGSFLTKVLIHELGHCALVSFGLLEDIHRLIPRQNWIEAEEWTCNFLAEYGLRIFSTVYGILGDDAIYYVPRELERFIA